MTGFVLGVTSSLVASFLFLATGWLGSRSVRRWLILLLSRLTGIGVVRAYAAQKLASVDLAHDLESAQWVKILAGRGSELTRDSFQPVWARVGNRVEKVEILLPDPNVVTGSWLDRREEENQRHDPGFRGGVLRDQVQANIAYLKTVAANASSVQLRVCNLPQIARLVITNELAYITVYNSHQHGRNSPCLVVRSSGPLYDLAIRMFAMAWLEAEDVT